MCNCTQQPCNSCNDSAPCNCPPEFTVASVQPNCGCCPEGTSNFQPANPVWPNGYCTGTQGNQVSAIPCTPCEDSISTNCVTYRKSEGFPINCFGIIDGDTLTTIINKMCLNLKGNVETILSAIGLDTDLGSAFCQLAQNCPSSASSTTPILGAIIVHYP